MIRTKSLFIFSALLLHLFTNHAEAVVPSEKLMAPTTCGYVSIADIATLHKHWLETQMGQLSQDEAMQPFVQDLKRQLQNKISGVRDKLGLDISDLKEVAGGEIAVGMAEQLNQRATVSLFVDITDHEKQLTKLLKKIDKELTKRNAKKSTSENSGVEFTTYQVPDKKNPQITYTAIFFVKDNQLCATDNAQEAAAILKRLDGNTESLADQTPYMETMRRCTERSNGLKPEVRWFFDPFGYTRCVRSLNTSDKKQYGKDYVKILNEQGFDAIKGIGGFVNLSVANAYEILHRTSVYAPPIPGESEKYRLAMRMMKFPNRNNMEAHKWLPRKLATYRTFNCDLSNAFENFDTLFDAIAGYEEAFAGVLEGLERDPYGPQVDVRKDFVAHLGERIILVTDYEVPITPECERFMIVVELTDEDAVAKTVEKFMKSDPNASQAEFEGKVVWEIQEEEEDVVELDITSSELDLLDAVDEPVTSDFADSEGQSEPSAVCVTEGHLFIASHTSFLQRVISTEEMQNRLHNTADYVEVDRTLSQLLPGQNSVKSFVRMDEAFRPVYELLRQGKMPEAKTLLGRFLNRLLTTPDDEDEGILREQKIDGRQLPEFEMVRRYFGPAGTVVHSEDDGWFIVGATLSKLSAQARIPSNATADNGQLR